MTILQKLVAADKWLMSKLGGLPNETISAAAWNAHLTGKFFGFSYHIIDLLFYPFERDHCRLDWEFRREIYHPTFSAPKVTAETAQLIANAPMMSEEKFPVSIDMKAYTEYVDDQKQYGSCVAHAGQTALELMFARAGKPVDLSRMFLYYHVQREAGTLGTMDGGYTGTLGAIVNNYGCCLESTWQYEANNLGARPDAFATAEGKKLFPNGCTFKSVGEVEGLKRSVAMGHPVVITIPIHQGFYGLGNDWRKHDWDTSSSATVLGLHAVTIIGYDDNAQRFLVENSWASTWADGGFFGIPYEKAKSGGGFIREAYIFEDLPVQAVPFDGYEPATLPIIDPETKLVYIPRVYVYNTSFGGADQYRNVILRIHAVGTLEVGNASVFQLPAYVHWKPFMRPEGEWHLGFKEIMFAGTKYNNVRFINGGFELIAAERII